MLSITDADTTISFATPDDVRQTSEKAINIWVGAFSPLWVPFLTATAAGLGFWSMSQAMKRSLGFASLTADTVAPDAHLFAKWPGFALPFVTPWSRGWGAVVEDADSIVELTHEALSAPLQIAFETEEKLEEAVTEAVATAHESPDLLTPKTDDLFSVADTAAAKAADQAVEAATEAVEKTVELAADTNAAETAVEAETVKTADAVTKSARAVIDPVTETPVVPAVAEATAEKLPLPMADVSPAAAPKRPRKPKA